MQPSTLRFLSPHNYQPRFPPFRFANTLPSPLTISPSLHHHPAYFRLTNAHKQYHPIPPSLTKFPTHTPKMAFVSSIALRSSLATSTINATSTFGTTVRAARVAKSSISMGTVLPMFTKAMADYKKDYAPFADRGWGATVKAERWNGRHAMFGFLVMVITGYCKGKGILPPAGELLDVSQWGVVGSLGDTAMITQERAIILVAHIHVLMVSVAATLAPFSFQDKLLLEDGEADETPAGLFPALSPGLTKDAELWNCRVSMLGLICLVSASVASNTPILDVLNNCLGNLLY